MAQTPERQSLMPRSTPTRINADGDLEKQCGKCGEWWPFTAEFFSQRYPDRKLQSPCRACANETRLNRPCRVKGCTAPIWNTGTVYCRDHHYQYRVGRPPRWQWKSKRVQP